MLHRLRNDEIPTYFRQLRLELEAKQQNAAEFAFLDLHSLRDELRAGQSHVARSDEVLEAVLYGSDDAPHFSGWTKSRLVRFLERNCFLFPSENKKHAAVSSVVCQLAPLDKSKIRNDIRQMREQKVWIFRKRLRERAGEFSGRLNALFSETAQLNRSPLKVNLGAGQEKHEGYVNVDWSGHQAVYDDIVHLKKFKANSVDRIYSNHVLEHIPPKLIERMLRRWLEILKPGARVTARMPDARRSTLAMGLAWEEASDTDLKRFDLPDFLAKEAQREGTLHEDAAIQLIYGWSDSTPYMWDMSNQHKSLWTPTLARNRFEAAGFEVEVSENLGTLNTLVVARKR